jgi:16S rRNA (guanine527-N7)-methyltransferase
MTYDFMNDPEFLRNICYKNNLEISDHQIHLLDKYVTLLCEWNIKINLLSRKDIDNIWTRHIIGSLAFLFENSLAEKSKIVDVGTGGGLPGIPLAIMLPDCSFILVDSIRKKINAVDNILKSLSLGNVKTLHGRAEELSNKPYCHNKYDYVIARAVGSVSDVVTWSYGFLNRRNKSELVSEKRTNGMFIFPGSIILMKGGDLAEEISRLKMDKKNWQFVTYPMKIVDLPPEDLQDKKFVIVREGKN